MAVLEVPLHLPVAMTTPMILRETKYSEVVAVEIDGNLLRIEHHRLPAHEIIRDLESLHEPLTFV